MFTFNRENALLAIVAGVVGFSLKSIFIKLAWQDGFTPIVLMGYRMLLSMPFFLIAWVCFRKREKQHANGTGIRGVIYCSLLYYISSLSDITGLTMVSVNIERIILFTIPVFVLIISTLVMKKRYHYGVYAAAFFSWVGVAVAYYGESHQPGGGISFPGLALIFISAIAYAGYFIISGEEMKKRGVIVFNSQVMLLSSLLSLIPLFFQQGSMNVVSIEWQQFRYPLLLALISTVAPSFLMMYGVKRCGAVTVAIINNIGPFFTMICGYWILHTSISIQDFSGMIIVVISVLYLNRKK